MTKQLAGKVAVITGAGRGIGRAIASGFAEQGAQVVCAARTSAQIDETVHAIRDSGGEAIAVPCDVGDAAAVERLYAEARAHFGPVDIVVANAGGNFSRASVEDKRHHRLGADRSRQSPRRLLQLQIRHPRHESEGRAYHCGRLRRGPPRR